MAGEFAVGDINSDGKPDMVHTETSYDIMISLNTSVPKTFNSIDTTILSDTLSHTIIENSNVYFLRKFLSNDSTCKIIESDSIKVRFTYSNDSIKQDSIFVRTAMICKPYMDTLIHSQTFLNSALIYHDTLQLYSHFDTLFSQWQNIDTLIQIQQLTKDTIILLKVNTIENKREFSPDCYSVEKRKITLERKEIVTSYLTDIRIARNSGACGTYRYDTLHTQEINTDTLTIASDTVKIELTEDSLFNLSAEAFNLSKLLSVFPVPTTDLVEIGLTNPCLAYNNKQMVSLKLYDMCGRFIYGNEFISSNFPVKIAMNNYASGIYCLHVFSRDDSCTKFLVKED